MKTELPNKILLFVISFSMVLVIAATAYRFLWLKDYNFIVEAECDPGVSICYFRDCVSTDECPPNGLGTYRVFEVSARDFGSCSNDSCLNECVSGSISCSELVCSEENGDVCVSYIRPGIGNY